jgi:hypothetical protein
MSHYKKRKESQIIPSPSREVSASTTVLTDDSYIVANGPASSGGGPGFVRQTDSIYWSLQADYARYASTAVIGTTGNNITMSCWINPLGATSGGFARPMFNMFENITDDLLEMYLTTTGQNVVYTVLVKKGVGAKQYSISPDADSNLWANFTFTYVQSTQTLRVYLNGIEDTTPTKTQDGSPGVFDDTGNKILEFAKKGNSGGLSHELSAAIWDGVLTPAEISAIYNAGDGGNFDLNFNNGNYGSSSNLIHWYRMGHQVAPDIFNDYALAGSFQHDLDSTNQIDGDIVVDAPGTSSAVTVTLPDNVTNNARQVTVQDKQGSAAGLDIIVAAAGTDDINGTATDTIGTSRGSKTYISDGTGTWRTIAENTDAAAPPSVTSEGITGTLLPSQEVVLATTGGITLTLPSAITEGSGKLFYVKDSGGNATANPITIDANGSETIDGSLTLQLTQNYDSVSLISDGANWFLI